MSITPFSIIIEPTAAVCPAATCLLGFQRASYSRSHKFLSSKILVLIHLFKSSFAEVPRHWQRLHFGGQPRQRRAAPHAGASRQALRPQLRRGRRRRHLRHACCRPRHCGLQNADLQQRRERAGDVRQRDPVHGEVLVSARRFGRGKREELHHRNGRRPYRARSPRRRFGPS